MPCGGEFPPCRHRGKGDRKKVGKIYGPKGKKKGSIPILLIPLARPARLERATCGFEGKTPELPGLPIERDFLKLLIIVFSDFG